MQWNYACRSKQLPKDSWVVRSCKWEPDQVLDLSSSILPHRSRGRPFLRWDQKLGSFSMAISDVSGIKSNPIPIGYVIKMFI